MFALILDNKVVEITDKKFPVAKSLKWIKCDESVKIGWFYTGKKFRQSLQSDEGLLNEIKDKKTSEIKLIRNQKNIAPIICCKAFVINDSGKKTRKNSDFLFYTNRHQTNPSSDPDSIISRVLNIGPMSYFTQDIKGNPITIELTPEIAKTLHKIMVARNDDNYSLSKAIEAKIKLAKTITEVETISWPNQE